jgi:hypothetical protein
MRRSHFFQGSEEKASGKVGSSDATRQRRDEAGTGRGHDKVFSMFAVSRGELVLVVFIFALVWGAGLLPRVGERLGARFGANRPRDGG